MLKTKKKDETNILLYLMRYPHPKLLDYFVKELKIPINICNIFKRICLYFLFDSINIINDNKLVIDTLNYLIKEGINIEQIDYLGNNPFPYLAINNYRDDISQF